MTKFVRLSEKGNQVCWEVDEEGNRCTGQLDEWGNLIDRYGRVYVDDVVGVGDVEKHGRCYTKVEGVLLRDRVRKGLVRTYLDGISVGDVYKNGVTKRCGEVITIIQSTYRRFARRSLSEMITPTDKMKKSIIHNLSQQLFINDWNRKCPRLPRSEEIVVSDGIGKISLRKVVRDNVRVVDISKKRVTHKIVDWVRLLDADVRERISEYGLRVWASLDEVGSYVSGRVDEWGMLVEERMTRGGGMWWSARKIFVEEIDVGDGLWKRPTRVGREVVRIVEKTWVRVSKRISDGVGVIDSVVRRPGKVVSESILASDGMGRVSLRKGVRDEIGLVDVSKKRVTHKVVDWFRLLDSDVREVMSEWGNRVWRSLDEVGSYVGGRLDEWGMVVEERVTHGGGLEWFVTKRFSEVLLLGDGVVKRPVRRVGEVIGIVEKRWVEVEKKIGDSVGVSDELGKVATKLVVDGIRTVDSVKRSVICWIDDVMVIGDKVSKRCERLLHDGVGVVDGVMKRPRKVHGEGVDIGDVVGPRFIGKVVTDSIVVKDKVMKNIVHVGREVIALLDGSIRWLGDEWGKFVTTCVDEYGQRVVGGLNEIGDWVGERITRGGALIVVPIKHAREVMGLGDVIGGRNVGKRIRESVTVIDKVGKRVIHDLVREVVGVTDEVRKRGIVKVGEVLVLGDVVVKRCGKVLRDSVGIVDYVRRRYEEIIRLVDNIRVVDSVKKQVGYNLRDVVSVVDEVRRGAVKRVGDVICVSEEVGREVVKRVRDVMRLKDVVRKRPERAIVEIVGISDWFRRVRDCVIGWQQVGIVKRISDGIARRRYEDVESVDENRKGEVGR